MTTTPTIATINRRFARKGVIAAVLGLVAVVAARRKGRRDLARLDDHLLRDIGLDRAAARVECSRRFWQD